MVTQRQWENDIIYESSPVTQPITAQGPQYNQHTVLYTHTVHVYIHMYCRISLFRTPLGPLKVS